MLNPPIHRNLSAAEKFFHDRDDDQSSIHPATVPDEDPYAPGSDNYELRTREQLIELPGGIVRVDYGASA